MGADQNAAAPAAGRLNHNQFDAELLDSLGLDGRTMLLAPDQEPWRMGALDLDDISLMRFREGGPNVYEGTCDAEAVQFFIGIPSRTLIHAMGAPMDRTHMVAVRPGDPIVSHSRGICGYYCLSVPREILRRAAAVQEPPLAERLDSGSPVLRITPAAWEHASGLAARAFALDGDVLARRHARLALADDLLESFVAAAASGQEPGGHAGRPRYPRRPIIARVREYLDPAASQPPTTAGMVAFVGIPARSLRLIVGETFGVSPRRLIQLWQMNSIRAGLLNAADHETVTTVTADHGVWEVGRFARRYHQVFGEYPSATLAAARRGG